MKNLIMISFILLTSCGYFENDGILFSHKIVGNLKIQQQENSNDTNLVFSYNLENAMVIINNLGKIMYDSKNQKVFTEEIINDNNSNYLLLKITDTSTTKNRQAFKTIKITKHEFDLAINGCKNCVVNHPKK